METLIVAEVLDKSGQVRERHRFEQFPVRIGRGYGNALMLDDDYVAPNHGVIWRCDDGSLEYRDLGSQNGTLLAGKAVRLQRLGVDQTLVLGTTRLRLRTPAFAVPPARPLRRGDDTLLHWQPGWPGVLAAAAGLSALVGGLAYLHQFNDPQAAKAVGEGLSALVLLLLWAGGWALLGRLFVQRSAFRAHVLVAALGALLVETLDLLLDPLVPVAQAVPGGGQVLQMLVMLPALFAVITELRLATHLHRRQAALRVLGLCAAVAVVAGVAEYAGSKEYDPNPDLRMAVQSLPDHWLPASTPAQFFKDARELKQAADTSP